MELHINSTFTLPNDAVTQTLGFLARRGAGKTYAAQKLAEEMLAHNNQIVVLDPVGTWWGLRLGPDGDRKAFDIPVFGGLHGDVPLNPTSGSLIADVIIDRAISAVIDLSQFETDADATRFSTDFARRLFQRRKKDPSPMHLFLEEAEEFVPQNPQQRENQKLHEFKRIAKLGRNFGFGLSLISQRPQDISKKVLNQTECLFAMQMTGPHERKAMKEWISEKGLDENLDQILPHLAVGTAHIWSPQWLKISETVKIGRKRTFDASSTPKLGDKNVEPRPLKDADMAKIREQMKETIERAKQDDPRLLRQKIRELEKELLAKAGSVQVKTEVVEKPVLARENEIHQINKAADYIRNGVAAFTELSSRLDRLITQFKTPATPTIAKAPMRVVRPVIYSTPDLRSAVGSTEDDQITGSQQRILDEMGKLHRLGVNEPNLKQIAVFCGVSHTTGSYLQNIRDLDKIGYIVRNKGAARLTETGTALSRADLDGSNLIEMWLQKLDGAQAKMLSAIIDSGQTTKPDLAQQLGVSYTTGSFLQNIRDLRNYGLITADDGEIKPSDLLLIGQ